MHMTVIGVLLTPIAFLLLSGSISDSDRVILASGSPVPMNLPPCIEMYNCIEKYSGKYDIPKKYAYGVAFKETRYEGAFHWRYNHKQTSCAGAVGPMQIMYTTARMMWKDREFTKSDLKNNIDFNVETSMKLLRHLHDKYKDWKIVFGCYNTGRPVVNQYAIDVYNF